MKIHAYLNYNGNCEEAFRYYEKVLKGKLVALFPFENTPAAEHVDPAWANKVMHARLEVGDQVLLGSDAPPPYYQAPAGFSVSLHYDDPAEGERVFHALAEGGEVTMPYEPTFWAAKFGMARDRFGIHWMVNVEGNAGNPG